MLSNMVLINERAFPLEIFYLIVKGLVAGERSEYLSTLQACCLVCKSFVPICRPYIFRSITYGPFGNAALARSRFAKLFAREPALAACVKTVRYILQKDEDPPVDTQAVLAQARQKYGSDLPVTSDGRFFSLNAPPTVMAKCLLFRQHVVLGGRMDDIYASLSPLLPNVENLSITHRFCHTTPADATHPCRSSYCREFAVLVLEEFGSASRNKLISLSITGVERIPIWNAMKLYKLETLQIERCHLERWNCPFPDSDDEEDHEETTTVGAGTAGVKGGGAVCASGISQDVEPLEDDDEDSSWETDEEDASESEHIKQSLPPIKILKVIGTENFSLDILQHLPLLESVDLERVDPAHEEEEATVDPSDLQFSLKHLHTLVTDQVHVWHLSCNLAKMKGLVAFPELKILDVVLHDELDLAIINDIFDHVQQLETLKIKSDGTEEADIDEDDEEPGYLNLCDLMYKCKHSLKHISLTWAYPEYDTAESVVTWLSIGLLAVSVHNIVETIDITLDIGPLYSVLEIPEPDFDSWKALDLLLTEDAATGFPRLRKVSVAVNFRSESSYESPEPDGWITQQFLRKPLERLHASTDIEFTCAVTHF